MANFIAKFIAKKDEDEGLETWMIWTNDSSNQRVGGVGVILQSLEGDIVEYIHL